MKPLIITALLLSVASVPYAQESSPLSKNMEKRFRELRGYDMNAFPRADGRIFRMPNKLDSITPQYKRLLDAQRFTQGGLTLSTFSHETSKGKIYTLSPDNMPCLVPDSKRVAVMPNGFKGVIPDEKMNAIPKVQIIPVQP